MAVDELLRIVAPPQDPDGTGGRNPMQQVIQRYGMALPADYVELANTYGMGHFEDNGRTHIRVFNPFSDIDWTHILNLCAVERRGRETNPGSIPHPIYPEPGGLLPWAIEADGGLFYWLTEDSPDHWPILIGYEDYYERFDVSITTFLACIFTRKIECFFWRSDPIFFSGPQPVTFTKFNW
jgi:hypothetical protein